MRCQRKGSVLYGLGDDFSLPHSLVGDKVSEKQRGTISEPRAEILWCIVMVQRSGSVQRYRCRLYFSLFFSHFDIKDGKSPKDIVGKKRFIHVPCHVVVKFSTGIVYNLSWYNS